MGRVGDTARRYRDWARFEAHGSSALYEDWAVSLAADPAVLALVEQLPRARRQPNLVFAAARAAGAPLVSWREVRGWLVDHWPEIAAIALTRTTQTNEAGRCGVLLPALSRIDGPIALIEVGASAGLCLYPDRYSYRYRTPDGVRAVDPRTGVSSVVVECAIDDAELVPSTAVEVAWRAGVDLNPLDVTAPDDVAWLRTLIWPEHAHRRERLDAAVTLATTDPPHLVRGDLLAELDGLLERVPDGAHVVVQHSAVLVYVDPAVRSRFIRRMERLDGTWLSNEAPGVLPSTSHLPHDGRFVLAVDGVPLARTHPHGERWTSL